MGEVINFPIQVEDIDYDEIYRRYYEEEEPYYYNLQENVFELTDKSKL